VAFDAAGNLYTIDNNKERLRVYALPKAANTFTTPANTTITAGIEPAKANVYASELSRSGNTFTFTLNDNTDEVIITLYDDANNAAATYNAGALAKGIKSVTHDFTSQVPAGTYSWSVTTQAAAVTAVTKVSDDSQRFLFWGPRGVAVDNSFASPFFGRVYASEGSGGAVTAGSPNPTRTTTKGVYIFNAALEDITAQGATAYAGGVTWGGLYRPAVAPDGKVYLADNSIANSGLWVMDPANPSANFTPVFDGTRAATGIVTNDAGDTIHGRIPHAWIEGAGTDTKLYTFDAGANNTGNINRYDIGTASLPWTAKPSAIVYNDAANSNLQQNFNSTIVPDGRGGWWISQYRATDAATIPSLIHVKEGVVDFNSGSTGLIGSSYQGGMAVSVDGKWLAIGATSGTVKVFEIAYDATTGAPTLTEIHSIPTEVGAYAIGVAFDAAGNLYAIDNNKERLRVYALPKSANTFTTPAQTAYNIVFASSAPPTLSNFELENGNTIALRRTVDLNYAYSGGAPTSFIVSETQDFSDGASWQTYNPSALTYTFATDDHGYKTVYTKLRNDKGESAVMSDDILYKPLHPMSITDFTVNSSAVSTSSRRVTLNHTVENGVPAVYSADENLSKVGKVWLPYEETPVYTLSEGVGVKEVYLVVANATDTSEIVSDQIYLDESVTVDEHGLTAKLFPNPLETDVNVVIEEGYSGKVDVTVYSVTGVAYLRQTVSATQFSLDLSKCPHGVLLVKLSSGNNYTVKRVIKL
jgi:hypothetical protein